MLISQAFPGKYLKAADLRGRELKVTITAVVPEEVGMTKDRRPVVYFKDQERGLVLNKVNSTEIARVAGDDTNNWPGTTIILYETSAFFAGEMVPAIRVKMPQRQPIPIPELPEEKAKPIDQPAPWEPTPTIITEAEAMARNGSAKFRDWRDRLSADEYAQLKPELSRITAIARKMDGQ